MSDKFSKEERGQFYDAIMRFDPNQQIVIADKTSDSLHYSSRIVSNRKISGRPSDEELTRAVIIAKLVADYGYTPSRLRLETSIFTGGHATKPIGPRSDIVILDGKQGTSVQAVCEVKRIHRFKKEKNDSIEKQLFIPCETTQYYKSAKYLFYLSLEIPTSANPFPIKCIGISREKTPTFESWSNDGKPTHFFDLFPAGPAPKPEPLFVKLSSHTTPPPNQKDLNANFSISDLRKRWRNIWEAVWGGTLEDNKYFENFNKVLLAKIYDERKTVLNESYTFQKKWVAGRQQSCDELASDIDQLYRMAYREYLSTEKNLALHQIPGIDLNEFPPSLIEVCVKELADLSLTKRRYKNIDILGEFYEMVIRESFKQTKGLYLTHPNIVLFILAMLGVDDLVRDRLTSPPEDVRFRLPFIVDPSCGTGTFLLFYMQYVQKFVSKNRNRISAGDSDVEEFIDREMSGHNTYKWVKDYVFGIDKDPSLATAAQINMILHGDGSTNIFSADALGDFSAFSNSTRAVTLFQLPKRKDSGIYPHDVIEAFDIVVSNPPFNVKVDKDGLDKRFQVKGKSEAYFLERWYQLLKPGGRLGVVLPESFFSVSGDVRAREFLYRHFNIKAIVSLPDFAFKPHTNTLTSLLIAQKKTAQEEATFARLYEEKSKLFKTKATKMKSFIERKIASTRKRAKNPAFVDNVRNALQEIAHEINKTFGNGFILLPFFSNDFISNEKNLKHVRKMLVAAIESVETRWIISKTTERNKECFFNVSVDEIGFKAGKKGAKDRPNELADIRDPNGKRIYNLKYCHEWDVISYDAPDTVLGALKGGIRWQ